MTLGDSRRVGGTRRRRDLAVAAIFAALGAAALLAGCADGYDHAAAKDKAAAERQFGMARDRCIRIGFTPATSDFTACVQAEMARLGPGALPQHPP
ncbi:MAG TPA: hypothetical protein VMU87_02740 [Stellaceae bacterium]|nr:hypothetical protein [Stellaceae bacterium]